MRKPRAKSWRTWCHAGSLTGIVAAATALAPASELESVGYASRPGQSADQAYRRATFPAETVPTQEVQAEIDATLPIVDEDDSTAATETIDRPIYRLPAIEEMSAPAPVALPPTEIPAITPLPKPTAEQIEEPAETEVIEAEPPATLPTITILPPVDTPPDMTVDVAPTDNDVAPADNADTDPEPQTQTAPTITILPPIEPPTTPPADPSPLAVPPEQTVAPEPTVAPGPTEPTETWEADEKINDDFNAAWNESNRPEAETPSPALPPLPVRLPTLPPLAVEPITPIAEPAPPAAKPGPQMILPVEIPQAQLEPRAENTPPEVTPYAPTTAELSRQLLPTVQRAYRLAQQGAVYAAQTEFIQVLRRIAEAKDSAAGSDDHSRALAAGLRAIDEADDFAPSGTELEADVNVGQIASAHRTPVLKCETPPATPVRPAVAVARYHEFARAQLAQAVAGEQAGSMALHGLGKVHLRLARGGDNQLQHERTALAMFAAALDAGPRNHLAANEIGVLLSRAGYPAEASVMFRHAIDLAPSSTAYHNLAMTDRALGYHDQAAANERYAFALAQRDRAASAASRSRGIAWVAPQELSRMAQPMPIEMNREQLASSPPAHMVQPVGGPTRGGVETASKWPKKLIPGSFWR